MPPWVGWQQSWVRPSPIPSPDQLGMVSLTGVAPHSMSARCCFYAHRLSQLCSLHQSPPCQPSPLCQPGPWSMLAPAKPRTPAPALPFPCRPSWTLAGVVGLITTGLLLLVKGEGANFNPWGFTLIMAASCFSGVALESARALEEAGRACNIPWRGTEQREHPA